MTDKMTPPSRWPLILTYLVVLSLILPDDTFRAGLLQVVDDLRDDTASLLEHYAHRRLVPLPGDLSFDLVQVASQPRPQAVGGVVLEYTLQDAVLFVTSALHRHLLAADMERESEEDQEEGRSECPHGRSGRRFSPIAGHTVTKIIARTMTSPVTGPAYSVALSYSAFFPS